MCSPFDDGATLAAAWRRQVRRAEGDTALVFDERRWTYAVLHAAVVRAAAAYAAQGLQRGDRVVLLLENGPGFVAAFLACQWLGLVPVPLSPRSTAERVGYVLRDCGAVLAVIEPSLAARVRAQHEQQAYGPRLYRFDVDAVAPADTPPLVAMACEDPAFIQYTSGSTGESKGVVITHRAALENIRAFTRDMALRQGDVFASLLPLFHDMGLVCFGLAPLLLGHPLVLFRAESLSLYRWLDGIAQYRVSITGAPDSLLQIANRVVHDPAAQDLRTLRMLICGSEPVRRHSVEDFGRRFGVLDAIKPAYGMAELTLCATLTPVDQPLRVSEAGHVASGRPIDGVELRVRTADGTVTRQAGVRGEVLVRSPAAMRGYWNRADATAQAFDAHGYLCTGDVGYLDGEGYLYVVGRQKNLLVRGGEKYSPHDLEMAAQPMADIRRAAVVQLGDEAAAIVAVLEVDRLRLGDAGWRAGLARHFRQAAFAAAGLQPDACWLVAGGRIPTTENGKFRHAALRDMIERGELRPEWADVELEPAHAAHVA